MNFDLKRYKSTNTGWSHNIEAKVLFAVITETLFSFIHKKLTF